ncbi:MAG: tRNA lysidine(34) synthetase TilS [Alphaproteobacteria bacterium]|nr:tRNA lysidine(34) synthetase TilS [Alphaproteobacteria bacterium]
MEKPVVSQSFDMAMARFALFESCPQLAVAVSGGPDSMALILLADAFARVRGGSVTALTVDHGLRPESSREASQVAEWLRARGIAHHVLSWQGDKPSANLQAAAREARYRLLSDWCREHGVLHLLVAHTRDDQAETFLLRLARGSGVDGLSGMARCVERHGIRLLRPLLDVPKSALIDFLNTEQQPWIEDPSNAKDLYARNRLRKALPALEALGLTPARLAETAERMGRARAALEMHTAQALAESVVLYPAGYALLDAAALRAYPEEISLRVLAALLSTIGGDAYRPRREKLQRLHDAIMRGTALVKTTLSGCVFLSVPRMAAKLWVVREPKAVAGDMPVSVRETIFWDGRFCARLDGEGAPELKIGALGQEGWRSIREHCCAPEVSALPKAALYTLPALKTLEGVAEVPHIGFSAALPGIPRLRLDYRPARALAADGFMY